MKVLPNVFRIGATRKGKTLAAVKDTFFASRSGQAIVVIDPHGSLIDALLPLLVADGQGHRILFDKLSSLDRVLGFEFLPKIEAETWLEKRQQMDRVMNEFVDCCLFRRGTANENEHPWISSALRLAVRTHLTQKVHLPLYFLPYALKVGTDQFNTYHTHCLDRDCRHEMRKLAKERELQKQALPAERILTSLCHSPAVMTRCKPGADLRSVLEAGGIVLESGRGNVSEGSKRDFSGLLIRRVSQIVREHYNETGKPLPTRLVIDEALNSRLISEYEVRDLLEMQKMGLSFDIITQTISDDPAIMDGILEGCNRQEYFALNSDRLARFAADQVGIPLCDPFAVHHVDKRTRQVFNGYEWVQSKSSSSGKSGENQTENESISFSERPVFRDEVEETERFWSLNDQLLMKNGTFGRMTCSPARPLRRHHGSR